MDYVDGGGRVSSIACVNCQFCESFNRVRQTADCKFRNCHFAYEESDLRPLLRQDEPNDEPPARTLRECVAGKWEGHEINTARFIKPERLMHSIRG